MNLFLVNNSKGIDTLIPGYPSLSPRPPATNTKAA